MSFIQRKSNILNDKGTDSKIYWTVLNNFRNNIKIPSVPSVLIVGGTITSIVEKANIFNERFASQCIPLENNSKRSSLLINTDKRIKTVSIKKGNFNN